MYIMDGVGAMQFVRRIAVARRTRQFRRIGLPGELLLEVGRAKDEGGAELTEADG